MTEFGDIVRFGNVKRVNGVSYPGGSGVPESYGVEFEATVSADGPVTFRLSANLERALEKCALVKSVSRGHVPDPSGFGTLLDIGTQLWRTDETRPANVSGVVRFISAESGWRKSEVRTCLAETSLSSGSMSPKSLIATRATGGDLARPDPSVCSAADSAGRVLRADQGGQDTSIGDVYQTQGAPTAETLSFGGWGDHYYVYLGFDLPPAESTEKTGPAILCLYATGVPPNDPRLSVAVVEEAWSARTVTLNSRPQHRVVGSFGQVVNGWNAVDVAPIVKEWLSGRGTNHGFVLIPGANNQTNGAFAASEAEDRGKRPKLILSR